MVSLVTIALCIVGNKTDLLKDLRKVPTKKGREYAKYCLQERQLLMMLVRRNTCVHMLYTHHPLVYHIWYYILKQNVITYVRHGCVPCVFSCKLLSRVLQ